MVVKRLSAKFRFDFRQPELCCLIHSLSTMQSIISWSSHNQARRCRRVFYRPRPIAQVLPLGNYPQALIVNGISRSANEQTLQRCVCQNPQPCWPTTVHRHKLRLLPLHHLACTRGVDHGNRERRASLGVPSPHVRSGIYDPLHDLNRLSRIACQLRRRCTEWRLRERPIQRAEQYGYSQDDPFPKACHRFLPPLLSTHRPIAELDNPLPCRTRRLHKRHCCTCIQDQFGVVRSRHPKSCRRAGLYPIRLIALIAYREFGAYCASSLVVARPEGRHIRHHEIHSARSGCQQRLGSPLDRGAN